MLEKELEKKLNQVIKRLGGKSYKFVSPGTAGVPDRIIALPCGVVWFVELKAPGESLRPLQEYRMDELTKIGCRTAVISSDEDLRIFEVFVAGVLEKARTAKFWGLQ